MPKSMRIRLLAVGGASRWIAVSGALSDRTQDPLRGAIKTYATARPLHLFVDFTDCQVADLSGDMLREVIAADGDLQLHLICVPEHISRSCAAGRRCEFHPDVRSAWTRWEQIESAAPPMSTTHAKRNRAQTPPP
ncbi:hypothetical protein [Streptomyces lydicus]|uniref:hypothetical protein n=1 Tax=Streptomyces lydicus TaxID=47763 RepID=UPI0010109F56|nr:hypothetical protein [Streptomyces lydicus]MCZ1006911.1 hypothetical protein [Streptomyces lydicus]